MKYTFTLLLSLCTWVINAQETWTQKQNFPTVNSVAGRDYYASFAIGNKVYVGNGHSSQGLGCNSAQDNPYKDWYAYDALNNTWTRIADFPGEFRYNGYVSFSIGGKGYFGTGNGNSGYMNDFWEYNPASNTWTRKADVPYFMANAVGYTIVDKGYIVGGIIRDPVSGITTNYSTTNLQYDPATNTWNAKATIPKGLVVGAGFAINDKGYIGLGIGSSGYNTDFYAYTPASDSWNQVASYPKQSKQSSIGFSMGNLGYILGGDNGIQADRKDVYAYDPTSDSWSIKASYPGNFVSQNISGGNRQNVVNNKFYYGLGHISSSSTVCGSYTYSYSCGSWWSSRTCTGTAYYYSSTFVYSNQWWEFALPLSIETGTVNTSICQGSSFDVPYVLKGQVAAGNIFTAQLSDASGSFANPVAIGSLSSTASGTIRATLPAGTTGSGFRVRVVSSTPAVNGTDNGTAITINALPSVNFQLNKTAICFGEKAIFTNGTTGASAYSWTFGDGTQSTSQNFEHDYTTPGTYQVKLIATSASGCVDSITKTIIVYPKPTARFSLPLAEQCVNGNSFTFKNESVTSQGALTYSWKFGDGNISTLKDPVHVYAVAGNYQATLIVTNENGCTDTAVRTISVFPKPTPAFTINNATQCVQGNSFSFTNSSTLSIGTMSYKWNFGDGNTSGSKDPVHIYASAGNYIVKLVVVTDKGCSDSITRSITINPKPVAGFNIDKANQCVNGNRFSFTNASAISSGTLTYRWTFGDGNTSTQKDPVHVYANAGAYTVQLIASSSFGCNDTITKSIMVYPKPVVSFDLNDATQCLTGNRIELVNNSSIPSGTITHSWSFGDGNTSAIQNPVHSYVSSGVYSLKLVSISGYGCADSAVRQVTIYPKPAAGFNINGTQQCLQANSFEFNNTSTISSGTLTYSWRFGDGTTSTAANPVHSYRGPGNYEVKLLVTSEQGCQDSISRNVTVNPNPVAAFTVNNTRQCINGNSFGFTNASTISSGNITSQWSFGDGNTSSSNNPVHQFADPGNYTVRLIITSDKGCKDTVETVVNVYPAPVTSFTIADNDQCLARNRFSFTNATTVSGAVTYLWEMGDGKTYNNRDVSHVYNAPGNYQVKLTVTNEFGCSQSSTQSVSVNPEPIAGFNVNKINQCLKDNRYQFTNTSTLSSGQLTYEWNFGDGATSGELNPSHVYGVAGNYTVQLKVNTSKGCAAVFISVVTVYDKPSASFTIADDEQCLKDNIFRMNNTSSNSGQVQYTWLLGDGSNTSTTNANKTYQSAGRYTIQLFTKNNAGCVSDTFSRTAVVHPDPVVNAGPDQLVLEGKTITITPVASGNNLEYLWTPGRFQLSSSTAQQLIIQPVEDITYTLTVTGSGGCKNSDQVSVKVLKKPIIPNAFSPNGDGMNDVWVIKYLDNYPGATVEVFNRAGQMVYRTQGYNTPWNGTYKGNPLPVGTYYYVIDPKNGREKISGSITILK